MDHQMAKYRDILIELLRNGTLAIYRFSGDIFVLTTYF